jgi:protein O-GlcNAc transferase
MASDPRLTLALKYHHAALNDEAWRILQDVIAAPDAEPTALQLAAQLRLASGDFAGVEAICRRLLTHDPHNDEAWNNLGQALDQLGRPDDALAAYERAIVEAPSSSLPHNNIGVVLLGQGKFVAAAKAFSTALRYDPNNIAAMINKGVTLVERGDIQLGLAQLNDALIRDPANQDAHDNRLFALHNVVDDPAGLFAPHRAWGQSAERVGARSFESRNPEQKIRIGYVSPDFRQHSVGFFTEPLLNAYDRRAFEVFCYSNVAAPDATTARFKAMADHWRELRGLSTQAVVDLITQDRVEILVDLAGHTMGNRLDVFAARAAPVQLTAIGYPGTTGLATLDGRLGDVITDPPANDIYSSEPLVRIAGGMHCYLPPAHAPAVGPLPCHQTGHITFGSFNKLAKISPTTIALWANVLAAVPQSRLLIKTKPLAEIETQNALAARFAAHGIGAERLDLLAWDPDDRGHLGVYGRVDIALDPIPYNGTTTTCESLWMGVPVITLAGRSHAGRVGASLLTSAGMADLICDTPEQYVARAVALSTDRAGLSSLRGSLRARIAASRLCNAQAYTQALEAIYRQYCR